MVTPGLHDFRRGSFLGIDPRCAAKFATHDKHDFLVEASCVEIFHQRGDRLIKDREASLGVIVKVPVDRMDIPVANGARDARVLHLHRHETGSRLD